MTRAVLSVAQAVVEGHTVGTGDHQLRAPEQHDLVVEHHVAGRVDHHVAGHVDALTEHHVLGLRNVQAFQFGEAGHRQRKAAAKAFVILQPRACHRQDVALLVAAAQRVNHHVGDHATGHGEGRRRAAARAAEQVDVGEAAALQARAIGIAVGRAADKAERAHTAADASAQRHIAADGVEREHIVRA